MKSRILFKSLRKTPDTEREQYIFVSLFSNFPNTILQNIKITYKRAAKVRKHMKKE